MSPPLTIDDAELMTWLAKQGERSGLSLRERAILETLEECVMTSMRGVGGHGLDCDEDVDFDPEAYINTVERYASGMANAMAAAGLPVYPVPEWMNTVWGESVGWPPTDAWWEREKSEPASDAKAEA
jgi:hypothetical protein